MVWLFVATLLVGVVLAVVVARRQRPEPEPVGRSLQEVVADVRRLGMRFHTLNPRTPFIKVEALRMAYDRVLGECCAILGIAHLLGVLPAGPALDAERARVEDVIVGSGVRLPFAA